MKPNEKLVICEIFYDCEYGEDQECKHMMPHYESHMGYSCTMDECNKDCVCFLLDDWRVKDEINNV